VKDHGSYDLASEYGVQRGSGTGTEGAQAQLLLYTIYSEPMMKSAVFSVVITLLLVRHNIFVSDT
jgi:hypothetical protein